MTDTNVLISSALFKGKAMEEVMNFIFDNHILVLSSSIIEEVRETVAYKFPDRLGDIDDFFASISFEYQYAVGLDLTDINIKDTDDRHVIASAYLAQVDVLVTGDEDFFQRTYDGLEILRPKDFMKKYQKVDA